MLLYENYIYLIYFIFNFSWGMIEEERKPSVFNNQKKIIFSLPLINKPRNKELLTLLQKGNIFKNKNNNFYF